MYMYISKVQYTYTCIYFIVAQCKSPDEQLVVNFDPELHRLLEEVHHLSRPPLSVKMPPVIRSLLKKVKRTELKERRASLELVVRTYTDIQREMRQEERPLLHSKIQQVETVSACIYVVLYNYI